ncbi:uncharacterized protein LOC131673879 [Phymastichus coffea]|uniref:uncharacterized protein LOC131673879 n=1 Tax=Phymastichus coffea TaxID=108790 RepID=UPI00273C0428|nr:uncharacterized protein LOC131673879 [Phymastichus coffea]
MSDINKDLWFVIQRTDIHGLSNINYESMSVQKTLLPPHSTFEELKSIVFSKEKIEDNNSKIIKLRKYDNTLIPYSFLLQGCTKDKPFIIEIVNIHQFCQPDKRTISLDYVEAIKSKIIELEKRITALEKKMPNIAAIHNQKIEETVTQISNLITFLNRRVDELTPPDWIT